MDMKILFVDEVTGRVSFGFQSRKVEGIDKLIQIVLMSLLSSPGSDYLFPSAGGGIPDLIGSSVDLSDLSDISADVSRRVSKTETTILSDQISSVASQEEKLQKIDIVSVTSGVNADELLVRLRITNQLGRTRDVVL